MTDGWNGFDIGGDLTPDGRTWEEVIPKNERLGGPSEWGNSRWKDFIQCPWKYYIKHVKGLSVAVNHPRYVDLMKNLWVGGLYHECRARYYIENLKHFDSRGERISETLQPEIDEACSHAMFDIVDKAAEIQPTVATEARRILMGWMTLSGPGTRGDDRNSTMYVENLLETSVDGFPYTCRIDRVLWDDALGGAIIQEHKTASWYSDSLLAAYRTDPQILGQIYLWENSELAKVHGPLVAFEVDIAIKTKQREYHKERVPVNREAVRDWARCMRSEWALLQGCLATDVWPRRRANCFLWARACELQESCTECAGERKTRKYGFAKKAV
jgi:hypothetical protein